MNERIERIKKLEKYTLSDLCEIVAILRDERDGCPWDKKQTHQTLKGNFIEETYEVVEAINKNDAPLLCEELGDVLLQVAFHCRMEEEKSSFSIDDVLNFVCKKMIYRHPHIFSDFDGDISENWEKLKNAEKNRKSKADILSSVPRELPALMRAQKIWRKSEAELSYFSDSENHFLPSLFEDERELSVEEKERIAGEYIFKMCALFAESGVNAEQALTYATDAFAQKCIKKDEKDC